MRMSGNARFDQLYRALNQEKDECGLTGLLCRVGTDGWELTGASLSREGSPAIIWHGINSIEDKDFYEKHRNEIQQDLVRIKKDLINKRYAIFN